MRTTIARWCGMALAVSLAAGGPVFGQGGGGDPSFPKEIPPAKPKDDPEKRKPETRPERELPKTDPREAAGLIDLRPKFRKGQETRYVLKIKSDGTVGIPTLVPTPTDPSDPAAKPGKNEPEKNRQQIEQEINFVLRVTSSDPEKGSVVDLVYEKLKITIDTPDSTISWDSSVPPDKRRPNDDGDLLEPIMRGLIGSSMSITFDPAGNVTDIKGGDAMGLPGGMAGAGIDPKTVGSLFGPIKTSRAGSGLYRIGERWSNVDDVSTGPMGRFRMVTEHTLRSARAGLAEVVFTGRIEPGSESGAPGSPFQIKDSKHQGKYIWDTNLGQLKSMESEQEISVDSGPGGGRTAGAAMRTKATVRVERVGR